MDDDQDNDLISRLLLDDIEELQSRQKGKQAVGTQTDLEVALNHQREQILALQTSTRDRNFALSMVRAITTDQNLLAAIGDEERRAEQDRRYALSLSNGHSITQGAPSSLAIGRAVSVPNNDGAASSVMGDLRNRFALDDKPDNGEGSSRYIPSSRSRMLSPKIECSSCFEKCDAILFEGPCGHRFCRGCTRQMFLGAIKDEELYPPRCCGNHVPPETAWRVLDYRELQTFREKGIEYSSKDRIYCADPTCSKFIPPVFIINEHGTCPECQQRTHVPCLSLAHPGVDCPLDEELQTVLAVANQEKWKRCSNCRTMVELYHGCNHVTCRCGSQFCYVCGNIWKTCECPHWDENRIIAMNNNPRAIDWDRANRAANILDRLIVPPNNHEPVACAHNLTTQWGYSNTGNLQCQFCQHNLPEYIFVCRTCQMRACFRCRLHRFR